MRFDVGKCLEAFAMVLDFVEMDYFRVKLNHSRRVAYIALCLGREAGLPEEDIKDLYALSLLHDCGLTAAGLRRGPDEFELYPDHCVEGELSLTFLPLQMPRPNVIMYHHEHYNGTGLFRIQGEGIPFLSHVIHMADVLDVEFFSKHGANIDRHKVLSFAAHNSGESFHPLLAEAFRPVAERERFWADLSYESIVEVVARVAPGIVYDYDWVDLIPISETFMRIIDSKSSYTFDHSRGITERVSVLADHYGFDDDTKVKLHIAANLHDLGKLYVSRQILDKPARLDEREFQQIKKHAYFTRLALDHIPGFEDIARWASNHHEKLDGRGYPEGLQSGQIEIEARIVAVADIYQALTEDRPYRSAYPHEEAMRIMREMARDGHMDPEMVEDADRLFGE